MPQDFRHRDRSRPLRRLVLLLLSALGLSSCAELSSSSSAPKAPMDVAMDIKGQGMFYKGVAKIPRSFQSPTSFELDLDLTHWSHPFGGGIGFETHAVMGDAYQETAIYQPLAGNVGVVSLESGRILLRGVVSDDGQELDGDWFLDGKLGGGFRVARKGVIFP